jgi:DNA-binding SARP family transcriptional activator/Tfp pilus assembly protein PilF
VIAGGRCERGRDGRIAVDTEFCVLGSLLVRVGGAALPTLPGKQRALLATLLVHGNRIVPLDRLAEAIWGDNPPASARGTVRHYVMELRTHLAVTGDSRIATMTGGYMFRIGPGELDVLALEKLRAEAQEAVGNGAWARAADCWRAAETLWRDEPLADVPSELLRTTEVPRLTEMRLQTLESRIDADLRLGRHAEVIADLRQLTATNPLRERAHALLMLALYRDGQQAAALAAFRDVRRLLTEELGTEPGPVLRQLHQQILAADRALDLPTPAASSLARLQTAVRQSALAVVPRQLPAPARHFAGRCGELAVLAGLLDRAGSDAGPAGVISAIAGLAGVGKTALAIQWAHQVAGEFPDGQLYVNLRGYDPVLPPMPAAEAVRVFLDAFEIPSGRIPASPEAQAGLYRSVLAGKKVLIVADNAASAAQVRPLLPGGPGCLVLVTSRSTLAGLVAVDGAVPLSVGVLTEAEARDLLGGVLGEARVAAEPGAVSQVIELCGRLPLALAITAARAATRPRLPLAAVAAGLAEAAGRLDALQAAGDSLASVRAALTRSCDHLSVGAARMLRLLGGAHPGPDISAPAAASLAGVSGPQAGRQLAELADVSLVGQDAHGRYALHDLVRLYAAEQAALIEGDAERAAAACRMLDHYLHSGVAAARLLRPAGEPVSVDPPDPGTAPEHLADDRAAMSWFEAEHRVLIAAADHAYAAGQDTRGWAIAWMLQDYFYYRCHWHDQLAVSATALAAAVRLGDLARQARSLHYLAWGALWLGRHDDAESRFRHALDLFGQAGEAAWQAHAHLGLARLDFLQGQPARAAARTRQALELYTTAGHQTGQADAHSSLGWCLGQVGDYEQALAHFEQALTLCRRAGDRQIEAGTLDGLGRARYRLGQRAEAIACYQQALDLARQTGNGHQQAQVLAHLGQACQDAGDFQAAQTTWREALAILDDLHHPDAEHVRASLRDERVTCRRPQATDAEPRKQPPAIHIAQRQAAVAE